MRRPRSRVGEGATYNSAKKHRSNSAGPTNDHSNKIGPRRSLRFILRLARPNAAVGAMSLEWKIASESRAAPPSPAVLLAINLQRVSRSGECDEQSLRHPGAHAPSHRGSPDPNH